MELAVTFTIEVENKTQGLNALDQLMSNFPNAELGNILLDDEHVDEELDGICS